MRVKGLKFKKNEQCEKSFKDGAEAMFKLKHDFFESRAEYGDFCGELILNCVIFGLEKCL